MPAHPREQRHILTYTLLLCTSFSQELIRIVMMYGGIHTYDIKLSNGAWQNHHGRLPSMSRVIVYFMLLPPLMYLL